MVYTGLLGLLGDFEINRIIFKARVSLKIEFNQYPENTCLNLDIAGRACGWQPFFACTSLYKLAQVLKRMLGKY